MINVMRSSGPNAIEGFMSKAVLLAPDAVVGRPSLGIYNKEW